MTMFVKDIPDHHVKGEGEHVVAIGCRPIGDRETRFMTFDQSANEDQRKGNARSKKSEAVKPGLFH